MKWLVFLLMFFLSSPAYALEFRIPAGVVANDTGCKSIEVHLRADRPAADPWEEIYIIYCASKKPLYLIVACNFKTGQCRVVGCDAKTVQCPGMEYSPGKGRYSKKSPPR